MVRVALRPLEAQSVAAGLHPHRVDTASSRTHDYGRQVAAMATSGRRGAEKLDFELCRILRFVTSPGRQMVWVLA